jgi:hypothetical protein
MLPARPFAAGISEARTLRIAQKAFPRGITHHQIQASEFYASTTARADRIRRPAEHYRAYIQFWKIISRLNVAIEVPTNAAEIGSIAKKPAKAKATNAHNHQRGLLPRPRTYTSARLAIVADGK